MARTSKSEDERQAHALGQRLEQQQTAHKARLVRLNEFTVKLHNLNIEASSLDNIGPGASELAQRTYKDLMIRIEVALRDCESLMAEATQRRRSATIPAGTP